MSAKHKAISARHKAVSAKHKSISARQKEISAKHGLEAPADSRTACVTVWDFGFRVDVTTGSCIGPPQGLSP